MDWDEFGDKIMMRFIPIFVLIIGIWLIFALGAITVDFFIEGGF